MTQDEVLYAVIAVLVVAICMVVLIADSWRVKAKSLERVLGTLESRVSRFGIVVRVLKRQRDIAVEELQRVRRNDAERIAALEARLAKFDRVRDARGRIVGRP